MKKIGNISPRILEKVMKEFARLAIIEILQQQVTFTSKVKKNNLKVDEDDLVTSADLAVQKIGLNLFPQKFPKAGIIAEEDFACKCTDKNHNYYFTLDPLDGTKAFGRHQSHAVSTMVSFVFDGEVVAVTIGDPNTGEIFHTGPGSSKIERIYRSQESVNLSIDSKRTLKEQYLQLRCDPRELSKFGQAISDPNSTSRLFQKAESIGGSIGFTFSRLWKGEVGGVLLEPGTGWQTPWDTCPIMGISKKMGFKFFLITVDQIRQYTFEPQEENMYIGQELFCIHESRVKEFSDWCYIQGFGVVEVHQPISQRYINTVLDMGVQVFGDDIKFKEWLATPNKYHHGAKPIETSYPVIKDILIDIQKDK